MSAGSAAGVGPLHAMPTHSFPVSAATFAPETLFLSDPDADMIFLLETTPSGGTMLRLSDVGYITTASDTPASAPYRDRLLTPYNVELSIAPPDAGASSADLAFGVIELESGDEELDARLSESWEGREVTIKVGGTFDVGLSSQTTLTYAQFIPVLRGTVQTVGWSDGRIVLTVRERLQQLSEPVQDNVYTGAGGLEGGDSVKNLRKPLAYGRVLNVSPTLLDSGNQIYQWHDGAVDGVDAVRDSGVGLTNEGDVADITATSVSTGHFKTQNSGGYIRLGGQPFGGITLDGRGDKTGSVYVNTTAGVAKRIATRVGLVDPTDFEGSSFGGFPDTSEIGYVPEDGETAFDALTKLLNGIFGCVSTTRNGLLRVLQYRDPATEVPVATITDDRLDAIEDTTDLPPAWRVEVEYSRNWTPQDKDAISDALTPAEKELYSEPVRVEAFENTTVKTTHKDARVVRIAGFQSSSANALALATLAFNLLSRRARNYNAQVEREMFARQPGDVVHILSADSDLSTGRNLYVTSVAEDAAERLNSWGLWG